MTHRRLLLSLNERDPLDALALAPTAPLPQLAPNRNGVLAPRARPRSRWLHRLRSLLVVCLLLAVLGLLAGTIYLQTLPNVDDAQARVAAILRAHHGQEAHDLLTTKIGEAAIAVEDERFLSHHGVDTLGLLQAAWSTLTGQGVEGGSTIPEQLAKALYIPDDHTLRTKIPMMGVAIKLEQHYSKAQILDMYLNSIYFGDQQWGIAQASQTFFGKPPQALDWAEASLLAGLRSAHHPAMIPSRIGTWPACASVMCWIDWLLAGGFPKPMPMPRTEN